MTELLTGRAATDVVFAIACIQLTYSRVLKHNNTAISIHIINKIGTQHVHVFVGRFGLEHILNL